MMLSSRCLDKTSIGGSFGWLGYGAAAGGREDFWVNRFAAAGAAVAVAKQVRSWAYMLYR
jgi:hypothetical protein